MVRHIVKLSFLLTFVIILATGCMTKAGTNSAKEDAVVEPDTGYIVQIEDNRVLVVEHLNEEDLGKTWNELFDSYEGRAIWLQTAQVDTFKIGQEVRYWVEGPVQESYPEQATAEKIEVITDVAQEDNEQTEEPKENSAFRNIEVSGSEGQYTITGEARVFEATFHYAVSDGHNYLVEDFHTLDEGAPAWSPFTLDIIVPSEKWPLNGTLTLELFELSAKDGEMANTLIFPLESFGS